MKLIISGIYYNARKLADREGKKLGKKEFSFVKRRKQNRTGVGKCDE
jgi:hypothetical protein